MSKKFEKLKKLVIKCRQALLKSIRNFSLSIKEELSPLQNQIAKKLKKNNSNIQNEEMKSELVALDSYYNQVNKYTKQVKNEGTFSRRAFLQMSGLVTVAGLTELMSKKAEAMIPFGFFKRGATQTYVDDVFSTYLYTGTGGNSDNN
jgi:hypothetical protein